MAKLYDDSFLDTLSILSFVIGIMNYDENLSQSDKQDMINKFNSKIEDLLHHLDEEIEEQNDMLREILQILKKE